MARRRSKSQGCTRRAEQFADFASYDQDLETAMRGAKAALIKCIDF